MALRREGVEAGRAQDAFDHLAIAFVISYLYVCVVRIRVSPTAVPRF